MSDANAPRVVVALDFPEPQTALKLAGRLDPHNCRLKVGLQLYTRAGPDLVRALVDRGFDIFLDLKFHDIPNTVAAACAAAADLGVWMMNVHCLGGRRMLQAARQAVDESAHRPLLFGVTILTSHSEEELGELGLQGDSGAEVTRLASLAQGAGLDGVVCSPHEAARLREALGAGFGLITPGVRPEGSSSDDQRRTRTPTEALAAGADWLVVGRPITRAADPVQALADINQSLMPG
ncbi:MAG: orotidine-5'-phosphate decarboxylase [Acidiferrobacteraceae bacterium]|jgi:orotidine-5'-phosphate decarboxylase